MDVGAGIMQTAPMATLQIRDIPDDVYDSVAAAARAEQRSLSQQAVVELRRALNLDSSDERRRAVLDYLARSGRRLPEDAPAPEALIREDRNAR